MKLMHLSDLHIGRHLNEIPLLDDQQYILSEILNIASEQRPDAVLIAGDIYDKPVPSAEAVSCFDWFLSGLTEAGYPVLIISGNHDSAERVAFGAKMLQRAGVYISPKYTGKIAKVSLNDEYGTVDFWLLPYLRPADVRALLDEEQAREINCTNDAVQYVLSSLPLDENHRNVLLAHQFVVGATAPENGSEELSVGGTDGVDSALFAPFDYTALGHLHGPQNPAPGVRYCGSPLKYSFAEEDQLKSVSFVTLGEKGSVSLETVPLVPRHDMRTVRGTFLNLQMSVEKNFSEDYLRIVLTDEDDIPDALMRLRACCPNIASMTYDNTRTRQGETILYSGGIRKNITPYELFCTFFNEQNGRELTEEEKHYLLKLEEEAQQS